MRQALHIFKKDSRHLRFEIAIAIAAVAAFGFIEAQHARWLMNARTNLPAALILGRLLLPFAWWTLIGRAIYDEALPGDRQFWITRPYSWRSLLSAKVIFILAFINLPMAAAQIVILRAYGLPLVPALAGLFWSQVLLMIAFLLPIFVLSTLTTGFVQLVVAILAPCVIALFLSFFRPIVAIGGFIVGNPVGYGWVKTYILFLVICAGGTTVLLWQYARRGTAVARGLAVATAVLVFAGIAWIPWSAAFRIQSWLTNEPADLATARAELDSNDKSLMRVVHVGDQMRVELPLQLTGLPSDESAQVEGFVAEFDPPNRPMLRVDERPLRSFVNFGQHFSLRPTVDNASYKQVKDTPLTVRGSVYLTVYGNPQSTDVPFGAGNVPVPNAGICSANQTDDGRNRFVICSFPFRYPAAQVSYRLVGPFVNTSENDYMYSHRWRVSFSPFPADVGLNPVDQDFVFTSASVPWEKAVVGTVQPLAHIRLNFEIRNLRLADIELQPRPIPPQFLSQPHQ